MNWVMAIAFVLSIRDRYSGAPGTSGGRCSAREVQQNHQSIVAKQFRSTGVLLLLVQEGQGFRPALLALIS
jgi:hypothetical protein